METTTTQVRAIFHQKKFKKRKRLFLFFRLTFLSLFLAVFVATILLINSVLQNLPPISVIENPETALSTRVYSSDGQLIRSFYTEEHRIHTRLQDISPHVIKALIATEDVRFRKHYGVDPKALISIVKDRLSGKQFRGGSTITMQLARNLYNQIGRERSVLRKLKEMIVAVILERKFTKNEILEAYLNTVSFVGNTYGIQNAAKEYYGKDAKELKIEEAALLIGMLKATEEYNPRRHPGAALKRRNTVMNQMVLADFLTEKEAESLKKKPITIVDKRAVNDLGEAPYFTEHLRLWLKDWCEANGYDLYRDGLKVYTTIDSRMQQHAEAAVEEHLSGLQKIFAAHIKDREPWRKDTTILTSLMAQSERYRILKNQGMTFDEIYEVFQQPIKMDLFSWDSIIRDTLLSPWDSLKYYSGFLETGFIAMDPSNGHIKAWVGGINQQFFKYDHVYTGKRQVGSTFKPFVYAAAFENQVATPCDKELNQPIFFYKDKEKKILLWAPKNADGKFGGAMTLRKGLALSVNLITARVMKRLCTGENNDGGTYVCNIARRMGIESPLDCVPSLALGTSDLSVYELTGAYCTFPNRGIYNTPIFITRIEDRFGNVIQEFSPESREAMKQSTAYMMLDMLQGVTHGGTASGIYAGKYQLSGQEIGGKTGTTQNHSDGWFMGVTSNLVCGTWVGCSERRMRFRSLQYGQGARMAMPICALFFQKTYADTTLALPKSRFKRPGGLKVELNCDNYSSNDSKTDTERTQGTIMDFDNEF